MLVTFDLLESKLDFVLKLFHFFFIVFELFLTLLKAYFKVLIVVIVVVVALATSGYNYISTLVLKKESFLLGVKHLFINIVPLVPLDELNDIKIFLQKLFASFKCSIVSFSSQIGILAFSLQKFLLAAE